MSKFISFTNSNEKTIATFFCHLKAMSLTVIFHSFHRMTKEPSTYVLLSDRLLIYKLLIDGLLFDRLFFTLLCDGLFSNRLLCIGCMINWDMIDGKLIKGGY